MRAEGIQSRLKAERIQAKLAELPGWEAAEDGGALDRTYLFLTIRAAVAFVALVAEIGEANGYVPVIDLRQLRGHLACLDPDRRRPSSTSAPAHRAPSPLTRNRRGFRCLRAAPLRVAVLGLQPRRQTAEDAKP